MQEVMKRQITLAIRSVELQIIPGPLGELTEWSVIIAVLLQEGG